MAHIIGNLQSVRGLGLTVYIGMPSILVPALMKQNRLVPPPLEVFAMIDTGSSFTVITPRVRQHLGIRRYSRADVYEVGRKGPQRHDLYKINLHLTKDHPEARLQNISVQESPLDGQPFDCLIGLDVLEYTTLTLVGPTMAWSLSI